jgi:sterol desaturase/sphingolipid hydroxylase (fatty acid hydroxylase superfamily)
MFDELTRTILSLGVLVLLLAWESFRPFYGYFDGKLRDRGWHGIRNLGLGVLNAVLNGLLCAVLWLMVIRWTYAHEFGILYWADLGFWGRLLGAFLLLDLWMYGWHRLNHRVPFLWRFHRVHHSDRQMDVTTASRFHFGEIVMSCCFRAPVIAIVGVELWELAAYEVTMFFVAQFHHANVGLPFYIERFLRSLIVTPVMHKLHHSRWQPETDSNFAAVFSIWDRLFRTFRLRKDPREIRLGLDESLPSESENFRSMLLSPLRERVDGDQRK